MLAYARILIDKKAQKMLHTPIILAGLRKNN